MIEVTFYVLYHDDTWQKVTEILPENMSPVDFCYILKNRESAYDVVIASPAKRI